MWETDSGADDNNDDDDDDDNDDDDDEKLRMSVYRKNIDSLRVNPIWPLNR